MTFDEIQSFRAKVDKFASEMIAAAHKEGKPANLDLQQPTFTMFCEVAYQLAVLNERNAPRWVWFTKGLELVTVDANKVIEVFTDQMQVRVVLTGDPDATNVDGTFAEVCAKLGIPTHP